MSYNLTDEEVKMMAAMSYGENRGQGDDAMLHTLSSAYNRIGKNEWRNKTVPEILQGGYYAVSDTSTNTGYADAMAGKFKSKDDENEYKRHYIKASAMNRGTLQPTSTQFYFKQPEINNLDKKFKDKTDKSSGFDFSLVEEGDSFMTKVGGKPVKFRTFRYK